MSLVFTFVPHFNSLVATFEPRQMREQAQILTRQLVKFYQTKDSPVPAKETDTTLTPEGKLPVASLKEEFGVKTLKEIRDGKAFLISARSISNL